jgi:hypothetical protein
MLPEICSMFGELKKKGAWVVGKGEGDCSTPKTV